MSQGKYKNDESAFRYVYDSVHFREKQLAVLYTFARQLLDKHTKEEIAWSITEHAISQLGFEDCVVYLHNTETKMLEQVAAYGPKNPFKKEIKDPIQIPVGEGIAGSVVSTGMPELVANTREDERYIVDDTHRASEVAVPIILNGKVIGVIDSESSIENFYTHEHVELLLAIATMAALRLNHAASHEKLELYQSNLETLVAQRTQELNTAIADLKRSNLDLENYAHAVSHDLMEPIRNISSFLGLVRKKERHVSDDGQVFLKHAFESAKRLEKMLSGLLAYSKIKTSKREVSYFDLNEVFQNIITDLSHTIHKEHAELILTKMPTITGYKSLLRQMFQNLIINAIKFAQPGVAPVVKISHELVDDHHHFTIQDNGIGIEPCDLEDVFDLFSRAQSSEHINGTGLGLSLSQRIIELHQGEIIVESGGLNTGSTFYVKLPLSPDLSL